MRTEDRQHWQLADQVLDELLDLPANKRLPELERRDLSPAVTARVSELLAALDRGDSPLDQPVEVLAHDLGHEEAEAAEGRRLGPWLLVDVLGRGGMSVVWRARRVDGLFEREVAIKLLTIAHLGADAEQRLNVEGDILARLQHPGIAGLLDAGVADDGTPWLATEIIEGMTLDRWCDQKQLRAREIVLQIVQVAEAVAYAHRNLVVHRDLKPANILVDNSGRVRLLDFGIAKILDEAAPEATATQVLTPAYGAPEQLTGEPVTTATDVWGLGAVLYRLLVGTPPRQDTTPGDTGPAPLELISPSAAGHVKDVDSDLDLVVLKALRQEPERRYPGIGEMADDLQRWLDGMPVAAAPDTFGYRLRKLILRRRGLVSAVAVASLLAAAGIASTLWQADRARLEAERAMAQATRAKAVTRFLVNLFDFADPDRSQGESLTALEILDVGARQIRAGLTDQPEVQTEVLGTVADIYRRLGLYDEAAPLLDQALTVASGLEGPERAVVLLRRARLALDRAESEAARSDLEAARGLIPDESPGLKSELLRLSGDLERAQADFPAARQHLEAALELDQGHDPTGEADDLLLLAEVMYAAGDLQGADAVFERALSSARSLEPAKSNESSNSTRVARVLHSRGVFRAETHRVKESLEDLHAALLMREKLLGQEHPDVAYTLKEVGAVLRGESRMDEAEVLYLRALDLTRSRLGNDHPAVLDVENSLALLSYDRGEIDLATDRLTSVVERARTVYGEHHPVRAEMMVNLAAMHRLQARFDVAEDLLLEALEIQKAAFAVKTLTMAHTLSHLGNLDRAQGRLDSAHNWYLEALETAHAAIDADHPEVAAIQANIGSVRLLLDRADEAIDSFSKAWSIVDEGLPEKHPLRAVVEVRLARALAASGEVENALRHARAADATISELYESDHPRRLEAKLAIGEALVAAGQFDSAEEVLMEAQREASADGRGAEIATAIDELLQSIRGR